MKVYMSIEHCLLKPSMIKLPPSSAKVWSINLVLVFRKVLPFYILLGQITCSNQDPYLIPNGHFVHLVPAFARDTALFHTLNRISSRDVVSCSRFLSLLHQGYRRVQARVIRLMLLIVSSIDLPTVTHFISVPTSSSPYSLSHPELPTARQIIMSNPRTQQPVERFYLQPTKYLPQHFPTCPFVSGRASMPTFRQHDGGVSGAEWLGE